MTLSQDMNHASRGRGSPCLNYLRKDWETFRAQTRSDEREDSGAFAISRISGLVQNVQSTSQFCLRFVNVLIIGADLKVRVVGYTIVHHKGRQCYNMRPRESFSDFPKGI